ncbi:hypothetical protein [uncultured Nostoc sp.]|uniref:hypothetical protein n=1 Tax=uncultured Nostoc sp. TaxID=340711 RepID=UPI0026383633|nr:hypothetical protein [uncultured Nostoc sp.]
MDSSTFDTRSSTFDTRSSTLDTRSSTFDTRSSTFDTRSSTSEPQSFQCPMPDTTLGEAAPTASPNSWRGCTNGYAQDKLSTSAQCPNLDASCGSSSNIKIHSKLKKEEQNIFHGS